MPTEDKTPCVWAADLVERLADSGTPADKLRPVRDAMAGRWADTAGRADDDPARHLSAAEAAALLADRFGPDHGTARKAHAFVTVGHLQEAPRPAPHPSELIPPPPRGKAPAAPAEAPKSPPAEPGGKPGPGVRDLSVEVPTVGPRPVAPKPPAAKPPAPGKPSAPKPPAGKPATVDPPADESAGKPGASSADLPAPKREAPEG